MKIRQKIVRFILLRINRMTSFHLGYGIGGKGSLDIEVKSLGYFLDQPRTMVDVGANVGDYSERLMKGYDPKRLILFEPNKLNFQSLLEKFKSKSFVRIENKALSNTEGHGKLYSNFSGSGLASLTKRDLTEFDITFDEVEDIELIRFEDFWANELSTLEYIDFIKIDVEGHEMEVLEGFGPRIHDVHLIQFEFGGCNIDTKSYFKDFWRFFESCEFTLYRISPYGPMQLHHYSEEYERFQTTMYLARNKRISK